MIRTKTISYDLVVHILELTRDFCAVRVVYGRDTSYSEAESVFTDDYAHTCGSDKVEISRDLKRSMLGDTLFKILISSDIDTMLNLYKVINTEVGRDCNILFSSKNLLEITSVEATKGQALKFVADRLGIDIKDTIAIGDNYNDIDMIQVAGLGVAIFNAVDDLKSVADYVTKADNNKHAIKEIVDEFIL
jgi:Cof subfamily protein (haloacid dehalogenase superfamily)